MEFNLQKLWDSQKGRGLSEDKKKAVTELVDFLSGRMESKKANPKIVETFVLPFIYQDFDPGLIKNLCLKIPEDFPWDHREIYFDFRLQRWIKHVEPKTLKECMEDYWDSASSNLEAMAYFRGLLREFASRQSEP